ncbi:MAG: nucleotide pyrophosphatase, partial [Crocosphaera sp.]|nr:nucleotide pyrophosphatase [Crocosphaera sp.]
VWQDDYPTDVMESPDYGRFGPLPHYRAGSHRAEGLILGAGPGIKANTTISSGHVLDLAPTLLSLMDAPIPEYLEGKPLPINN